MSSSEIGVHTDSLVESAFEQLARHAEGFGPWIDDGRRPPVGWCVRLLAETLQRVKPDEYRANAVWEAFDELFYGRVDYVTWRVLGTPAFWRRGKTRELEFFRPRTTQRFLRSGSVLPSLSSTLPSWSSLQNVPWAIKLGIVGSVVDRLYQDNREAQRERVRARRSGVIDIAKATSNTCDLNSEELTSFFRGYIEEIKTRRILGACEGALFISFAGCGIEFFNSETTYVLRTLLPLIRKALRSIDSNFDFPFSRNTMPRLNLTELRYRDGTGLRFIPSHWEDQLLILCAALARIARMILWLLKNEDLSDTDRLSWLRTRAALLTVSAQHLRAQRIQEERRSKVEAWRDSEATIAYLRNAELFAFESAAFAASNTDLNFLAARLWQTFLWYNEAWSEVKSPPDRSYRIVAEAGLRMNPKTRTPKPNEPASSARLEMGASSL